jgi:hypothetical protein
LLADDCAMAMPVTRTNVKPANSVLLIAVPRIEFSLFRCLISPVISHRISLPTEAIAMPSIGLGIERRDAPTIASLVVANLAESLEGLNGSVSIGASDRWSMPRFATVTSTCLSALSDGFGGACLLAGGLQMMGCQMRQRSKGIGSWLVKKIL